MRILLVKPKAQLPTVLGLQRFERLEPLEFGYLAAAVPGHDVKVLDLRLYRFPDWAFDRALKKYQPDLLGFTAYSHESAQMKRLARRARAANPKLKIVVGGHHATVAPEDCNRPDIDYIVRGEGCGPFASLVAALDRKTEPEFVPNLYRTGKDFDHDAARIWPQYPDVTQIPLPRRDLWRSRDYYCVWTNERGKNWETLFPPVAMARTSYGCKARCTFCIVPHLSNGKHMPRTIDQVVQDLKNIPVDHVYFSDDENFIDEGYAMELAEAIEKAGVRKRYFAWTRATTIMRYPDLMRKWQSIGLDAAFCGFEFTTDEELRHSKKGCTVKVNEKAHEILREIGIACHAAFIVKPDYGQAEFQRLIDYVNNMPPAQFSFTVWTPSPGTEDFERSRARMWCGEAYHMHDCMHAMTPTRLPLKEFGVRFAGLLEAASRRNPLRVNHHLVRPWDLARAIYAESRYHKSFRESYKHYPEELWDWPGEQVRQWEGRGAPASESKLASAKPALSLSVVSEPPADGGCGGGACATGEHAHSHDEPAHAEHAGA